MTKPTPNGAPTESRRLLSVREAAERLGLSKSTLDKWRVRRSDGPAFVAIGRRVLYDPRAIEEFISSRVRRSTSDRGGPVAA